MAEFSATKIWWHNFVPLNFHDKKSHRIICSGSLFLLCFIKW
nr:MAG TPA: hypothetical protein [Caudoviricetes sp.]